ncbi:hypothetical protein J6590_034230 [Homalodisca vitripennis]|nr:hypothetical protein J6590_034230 [Homalodisca vitripennis]
MRRSSSVAEVNDGRNLKGVLASREPTWAKLMTSFPAHGQRDPLLFPKFGGLIVELPTPPPPPHSMGAFVWTRSSQDRLSKLNVPLEQFIFEKHISEVCSLSRATIVQLTSAEGVVHLTPSHASCVRGGPVRYATNSYAALGQETVPLGSCLIPVTVSFCSDTPSLPAGSRYLFFLWLRAANLLATQLPPVTRTVLQCKYLSVHPTDLS